MIKLFCRELKIDILLDLSMSKFVVYYSMDRTKWVIGLLSVILRKLYLPNIKRNKIYVLVRKPYSFEWPCMVLLQCFCFCWYKVISFADFLKHCWRKGEMGFQQTKRYGCVLTLDVPVSLCIRSRIYCDQLIQIDY